MTEQCALRKNCDNKELIEALGKAVMPSNSLQKWPSLRVDWESQMTTVSCPLLLLIVSK